MMFEKRMQRLMACLMVLFMLVTMIPSDAAKADVSAGSITTSVEGTAWLDKESLVCVEFNTDGAFEDSYSVSVEPKEAEEGNNLVELVDVIYDAQTITAVLSCAPISAWHANVGQYVVSLKDAEGNVVATEEVSYELDSLSEGTKWQKIATMVENEYVEAYVCAEEIGYISVITIIKSDKIHADGVTAGDVTYGWYNGMCSELYMTIDGVKYSMGSHVYLGQYANAIAWGTGSANGSFENSLIDSWDVTRGFMALGTFDDDTDVDTGCVLFNRVRVNNVFEKTPIDCTFSGYIGPNDGTGAFAEVSSEEVYELDWFGHDDAIYNVVNDLKIEFDCDNHMVEAGDDVTVTATIEAEPYISGISLTLKNALDTTETVNVDLDYQNEGIYVGTLNTEGMTATEWYVEWISFGYTAIGLHSCSIDLDYTRYQLDRNYIIITNDGLYEEVEYEAAIFNGSWSTPEETTTFTIETKAFSGRKTYGELWGEAYFNIPAHEELGEFVGWYIPKIRAYIYEDTVVSPLGLKYTYIVPIFEKQYVQYICGYYDAEYNVKADVEWVIMDSNATYGDLYEIIGSPVELENNNFHKWSLQSDGSEGTTWYNGGDHVETEFTITHGSTIMLEAIYDMFPVTIERVYLDENDEVKIEREVKLYSNGTSYRDIYMEYVSPVDMSEKYEIRGWRLLEGSFYGEEAFGKEIGISNALRMVAIYEEKQIVRCEASYIQDNGGYGVYTVLGSNAEPFYFVCDTENAMQMETLTAFIEENNIINHYSELQHTVANSSYSSRQYIADFEGNLTQETEMISGINLEYWYTCDQIAFELKDDENHIVIVAEHNEVVTFPHEDGADNPIGWYCKYQYVFDEILYGDYVVSEDIPMGTWLRFEPYETIHINSEIEGTAWVGTDNQIYIMFSSEDEFTEFYNLHVEMVGPDGTEVNSLVKAGYYEVGTDYVIIQLDCSAINGWHMNAAEYDISLVNSDGYKVATHRVSYAINDMSENTDYVKADTVVENDKIEAFIRVDNEGYMSIITVLQSDKIHADGVTAGDVTYGWYNGMCSEIYMTVNGMKYSLGSHVYLGKWANAISWGTGTENGSFENDLIESDNVIRGFMALGTFDDDTDVDTGCVLYTKVLANTIFGDEPVVFTLSGYIGPNDGAGAFEMVRDDIYYVYDITEDTQEPEIYKCTRSFVEATCTEDAYYLYTDGNGYEYREYQEGTATGEHSYEVALNDNVLAIECATCGSQKTVTLQLEDGAIDKAFELQLEGTTILLPTAEEIQKEGYQFVGWQISDAQEYITEVTIETLLKESVVLNAVWEVISEDPSESESEDPSESESEEPNESETEEVVEVNPDNLQEEIQEEIAKEKDKYVEVVATEPNKVDKELFDSIKDNDKDLSIGIVDDIDGKVKYSWTFSGDKLEETDKEINLEITYDEKKEEIEKHTGKKDALYINFSHHGELPGPATIRNYVGDKYKDGEKLYLYYYDEELDKVFMIGSKPLEVKKGYIEYTITHCSTYFVMHEQVEGVELDESSLADASKSVLDKEFSDTLAVNEPSQEIPNKSDVSTDIYMVMLLALCFIVMGVVLKKKIMQERV